MLVDDPGVNTLNPIFDMIAMLHGRNAAPVHVRTGVYEIGHFGGSDFLSEYDHYPRVSVNPYGVCDSIEQLLEACPELESSDRQFVVTLSRVRKEDQPTDGGWRWHKWGPYIGTQNSYSEYLHDELEVNEVFCYSIYERR
jgi:hypothetical protein